MMEENQNGMNGQEMPRTYGEESKIYESGQQPTYNQQPNYGQAGQQPSYGQAGQQVNYGQATGNQQANYNQQPNYGQAGQQPGFGQQPTYSQQPGYGQAGQQPNYGQAAGSQQPTYSQQPNYNQQPAYSQQPGYGQAGQQPNYNQQPAYSQQPNYNQPNYGAYNGYGYQPQPQHGPVTDIFCYILLVIMPLRYILAWIGMGDIFSALTYDSIMDGSYVFDMMNSNVYTVVSSISNLLTVAVIVFVIIDIVKIHQQNYKITGLILFAIFLQPGYYIWRAHILGRKKTIPIIYTVAYVALLIAYFIYIFYVVYDMVMSMIPYMY